jgi:hypothetical protein
MIQRTLPKVRKLGLTLLAAALLVSVTAPAASANVWVKIGDGTFEALVLRPFGFLASTVGAIMFIPAAVLTMPTGRESVDDAWRQFVAEPAEYVYRRPWGDF